MLYYSHSCTHYSYVRVSSQIGTDLSAAYEPTLMTPHENRGRKQVTQRFFWGTHSGVGGGDRSYANASDITLLFVVDEMHHRGLGLTFDRDRLPKKVNVSEKIHDSKKSVRDSIVSLTVGSAPRVIPAFHWIHESAVKRYKLQPLWRPRALDPLRHKLDHSSR